MGGQTYSPNNMSPSHVSNELIDLTNYLQSNVQINLPINKENQNLFSNGRKAKSSGKMDEL